MSAPQLTDPGASSEWFPAVDEVARSNATARRQRFTRLVTYAMIGLTAFAVLGLACFVWRRHTLQAALKSPPPAPLAQPATASPGPLTAALNPEPASPPAAPVSDPLVLVPAPPPTPVTAPKPVAKVTPKLNKKQPTRRSPFLSAKPQPATLKRR